jgi:hypothetical protein
MPVFRKYASSTAARIGKEAHDARVAGEERRWRPRGEHRVELACEEHLRQRAVRDDRQPQPARQRELHLLAPARVVDAGLVPVDRREVDAVLVRQHAARIHRGGLRPFRHAHALAGELARIVDARVRTHVDRRVPKGARRKDRQRHEPAVVLGGERHDLGERHLGDVEFAVERRAVEDLLDRQAQHGQVDAAGGHRAVEQIAHVVVVADRERERKAGHRAP